MPLIPATQGGWGRTITWTREVGVAVNWDRTIALQRGKQEGNSISKQTNKKNALAVPINKKEKKMEVIMIPKLREEEEGGR